MGLTVTCLPTSRRNSSTRHGLGPGRGCRPAGRRPSSRSRKRPSWPRMAARLASSVASSSRLRSSERPPGIADHARGAAGQRDRPVAGVLEAAQQQQGHEVADVEAVGGGIEADVEGDRAVGQALDAARRHRCCPPRVGVRPGRRGWRRSPGHVRSTGHRGQLRSSPRTRATPAGSRRGAPVTLESP